ncbi:hypothetical protein MRX96_016617 [Rhipicephalus microplus]
MNWRKSLLPAVRLWRRILMVAIPLLLLPPVVHGGSREISLRLRSRRCGTLLDRGADPTGGDIPHSHRAFPDARSTHHGKNLPAVHERHEHYVCGYSDHGHSY